MTDAPEANAPHENPGRRWYAEHCSGREYRAFRTLAEARERPDGVVVLDLDAEPHGPLATYPARRVEADPTTLDRLRVELGAILVRAMAPDKPALEGRVRYETSAILDEASGASRLDGVVLHEGLGEFSLESDVEAVFLGLGAGLGPDSRRRVDLLLSWREAVVRGDVDVVRELIDRGLPDGTLDRDGAAALESAIVRGDVAMVRLFLDHGVDPNYPDAKGRTLTTRAASRVTHPGGGSDDEILSLLIEAGGRLGLREAVILGDVYLARRILDADPTIDVSGDGGLYFSYTFLMVAALFDRLEMVRFLLDRGADVHGTDDDVHYTALGAAAIRGRADIAALLLDRGADPNHVDANRYTPLAYAVEGGHQDVIRLLLERGARRTLIDAILAGEAELVAELLPTIQERDLDPILAHCEHHLARCDLEVLRLLLHARPEVCRFPLGPKLLRESAERGRFDVVRLLLEHGCDLGEPDRDAVTLADHAERAGHAEVAEFLRAAARNHGA